MTALPTPFLLFSVFFVKKDTVNGIIGKTQGVSKAINPPSKPKIKIVKILLPFVPASPQSFTGCLISIDGIRILVANSTPP